MDEIMERGVEGQEKALKNPKANSGARLPTEQTRLKMGVNIPQDSIADDATNHLRRLNPEQLKAVRYGIRPGNAKAVGPLLIIAGAGTGKTTTIACRAAHLVVNGIEPHRILALAFTRRAARDLERRVRDFTAKALNGGKLDLHWSGTFHSIGARLLRKYAHVVGLIPSFTILDQSDSEDLINLLRQELGLAKLQKRFPEKATCLAIYSHVINSRAPLDRVLTGHFPWCAEWERELRSLFKQYVQAKRHQNVLDYDDLLLFWDKMLNDKKLAAAIGSRFDHILVDEYQDTNPLQASILLKLKPDGRGVTVVGDDAQAIYSFRAATVRNIRDFPNQFTPQACIMKLERNYRSTQPILHAANEVMRFAKDRFKKNLWSTRKSQQKPCLTSVADEAAQARYIAQQILRAREAGVSLKQQIVLFRASRHSAQLEAELARRNIPFRKYGGLKFVESAHVKDLIALLRWCENPRDRVAGFRTLQLLPGIGPSTAAKILEKIAVEGKVVQMLRRFNVPKAAAEDWPGFATLVAQLLKANAWPAEFDAIRAWYEPHLPRLYEEPEFRAEDIARLQQIAAGYRSRRQFLTELAIDPPDRTGKHAKAAEPEEEYTTLATIHWAKGGEWPIVRVLNVVDGCIPSARASGTPEEIEEERRLLHVAMTRAKDQLDLMAPQSIFRYQQGNENPNVSAPASPFIPKSIHDAFELRHWGKRIGAPLSGRSKWRSRNIDVAASIERMWE